MLKQIKKDLWFEISALYMEEVHLGHSLTLKVTFGDQDFLGIFFSYTIHLVLIFELVHLQSQQKVIMQLHVSQITQMFRCSVDGSTIESRMVAIDFTTRSGQK